MSNLQTRIEDLEIAMGSEECRTMYVFLCDSREDAAFGNDDIENWLTYRAQMARQPPGSPGACLQIFEFDVSEERAARAATARN